MKKIGVFICHCGHNIAGTIDINKVMETIGKYPGVAHCEDYNYMCSDPGQNLIKAKIKEKNLESIVVAACSHTLHEPTFRRAAEEAGINPYLVEIANIREQCSWIHDDIDLATKKAIKIISSIIEKVRLNQALTPGQVPVTKKAMVIGGGIAGIQSALDIANAGYEVVLVEKTPSIGGHMAQLSETFPTLDCSQCILTPKMVEIGHHEKVELLTYSEVEEISGTVGNFKVKIRRKSPYVDWEKCNGCADCSKSCPVSIVDDEFECDLGMKKAIYRPSPQSVPNRFTIKKTGWAPCRVACPAGVNVQGYISLIRAGKYKEALALERQANPFASVCGRVCNHPCESDCVRSEVDEPIAIASLKRYIADHGDYSLNKQTPTGDKIAVVGAGPAGLSCAYFLALKNCRVTVYEAENAAGGMLVLGIPEFRLPRDAVKADIDFIESFGVEIKTGVKIGENYSIEALRSEYRAVFIATGAYEEIKLDVPGEELNGVIHCIDFLKKINSGEKVMIGKKVAVIGGGNAALDAARVARRLGSDVTILYRRSRKEMPANYWEVEEAEAEGIKIEFLVAPVKIHGREKVQEIECVRMKLGEPDASGRRRPIPVPNSEFKVATDNIILAISQRPKIDWLPKEFETTKWGTLIVDPVTLETTVADVFAGGDLVSGPATVIEAVAAGQKAAAAIHAKISGIKIDTEAQPKARPDKEPLQHLKRIMRTRMPKLNREKRNGFDEVELGYDEGAARHEAERCLNCAVCCECRECETVCEPKAIDHRRADTFSEYEVGAIVVATGYDLYPVEKLVEYGGGKYQDVINGLQFERLLSASGPTNGEILRPSDNKVPKTIAFISCAGSRDPEHNLSYCSKFCCMYALKHALLYKERVPDSEALVYTIDVRTGGKDYEEFYIRAKEEKVIYLRGKPGRIVKENDQLAVWSTDVSSGRPIKVVCDMVVLAMAAVPSKGTIDLTRKMRIPVNQQGFLNEAHPKLRPVESLVAGYFLTGCAQGPKDIPETVAQASAAASKVIVMFNMGTLQTEPMIAFVDEDLCCGCRICINTCPYEAREFDESKNVVRVNEALCQQCGCCIAACPSGAAQQRNYTDEQLLKMVEAILG
ncbi:hypothetical protein A2Y85_06560 [candidate division WOR-3 bacterium RBG_13_43_14]|uniref:4Fe-4S ferredoxin-type domain-containing protein n=1 Tax=candidate division WOR-3 bacterium RBG_13_43_14 TaxID=1802590 RepID=A0A1F4U234_UNCW3|nr:MAG: hypothetical protein A2Y85_06560 [candidate division WOR-3 bacterium RBG_13_43_14]